MVDGDLWQVVSVVLASRQAGSVQCEWMPSHRDEAEARSKGIAREDWQGNATADRAAGMATANDKGWLA
eukprot:4306238-Alexandrium_andersonii.AAC.1